MSKYNVRSDVKDLNSFDLIYSSSLSFDHSIHPHSQSKKNGCDVSKINIYMKKKIKMMAWNLFIYI